MIKVYDSSEKLFNNNGIKILHPYFATITKEDNGSYYIDMRDNIDNIEYYVSGNIIRTSTPWGEQCFRIGDVEVNNNNIDIKAYHISYDMQNYLIKDINIVDKNCNYALNYAAMNTDIQCPFTFASDITTLCSSRVIRKNLLSVVNLFAGEEKYKGHLVRDNYNISIMQNIGKDRGVVIASNKNLSTLKKEEIWQEVVTKLLPYTTDGERAIMLDETYVKLDEEIYDIPYSQVIKFDNIYSPEDFEDENVFIEESKKWLKQTAVEYLNENKLPKINYQVETNINNVGDIGDIIHVKHPKCKIDILTNVISLKYDCINDTITKVEFGNFKKKIENLVETITNDIETKTDEKIKTSNSIYNDKLDQATSKINSLLKSSYVVYNGDEILVLDALPKENAKNVIKINNAGIGFGQNGIDGTFNSAWTIDGTLNMQNINVVNLTADMIKGGTLILGGANNVNGSCEIYDASNKLISVYDKEGIVVYGSNGDYVKLNAEVGFAGYDANNNKIYWADGDTFHMKNAQVENEIQIAGRIRIIPIDTTNNTGVGFIALTEV